MAQLEGDQGHGQRLDPAPCLGALDANGCAGAGACPAGRRSCKRFGFGELRGDPTLILDSCSVRAKRAGDLTGPNPRRPVPRSRDLLLLSPWISVFFKMRRRAMVRCTSRLRCLKQVACRMSDRHLALLRRPDSRFPSARSLKTGTGGWLRRHLHVAGASLRCALLGPRHIHSHYEVLPDQGNDICHRLFGRLFIQLFGGPRLGGSAPFSGRRSRCSRLGC